MTPSHFLVSEVTQRYVLTSQELELEASNEIEYVTVLLQGLSYLTPYDLFFWKKVHDFNFLYNLIIFHSIYVPHFQLSVEEISLLPISKNC